MMASAQCILPPCVCMYYISTMPLTSMCMHCSCTMNLQHCIFVREALEKTNSTCAVRLSEHDKQHPWRSDGLENVLLHTLSIQGILWVAKSIAVHVCAWQLFFASTVLQIYFEIFAIRTERVHDKNSIRASWDKRFALRFNQSVMGSISMTIRRLWTTTVCNLVPFGPSSIIDFHPVSDVNKPGVPWSSSCSNRNYWLIISPNVS